MSFHPGELEAQRRMDVEEDAARLVRMFEPGLNPRTAAFAVAQRVVVASSVSGERVVASLHEGPLEVLGPARVRLAGLPDAGDVGLLVIDPATRRRLRLNGRAHGDTIELSRVYGNCPKYIHARAVTFARGTAWSREGPALDAAHREWIRAADTFFLASRHPAEGADASHRGGPPGFVEVVDTRTLRFPDFAGNNMFNTLGNLLADARCGLLFPDFATGGTLQVSGRAEIAWGERATVTVQVGSVVETRGRGLLCHDAATAASQGAQEAR